MSILPMIRNERIKLLATALNNLGVGAILTGFVGPLVRGTLGDPLYILIWLGAGVDLIALAQYLLGRLR